jgi:hypothetical protein
MGLAILFKARHGEAGLALARLGLAWPGLTKINSFALIRLGQSWLSFSRS